MAAMVCLCNSGHVSLRGDQIFKEPNEILSNLNTGALPEPHKALENIHLKNITRLIFAQLNINSLRISLSLCNI